MDRLDAKRIQVLSALEKLWQRRSGQTILVRQVMTSELICVTAEDTLPTLVDIFHARRFRHLLVTDEQGALRGVISDRDVLRMMGPGTAYKEVLEGILAGEIMSTDLITIGPEAPLTEAIVSMVDHGISCLPVLDGERLLGIVTNTDLHILLQMLLQTLRTTSPEQPLSATPQ